VTAHVTAQQFRPSTQPPAGAGNEPHLPTPPVRAAGIVLATAFGAVARVTRRKPLHARGTTWDAELRVDAPVPEIHVPLFEDRGVHACVVRVSRALGAREGRWDIGGLAIRIPEAGELGRPADLLFATTGTGRITRHVLRPTSGAAERPLTTLLPTRVGHRSMVLLVRPSTADIHPREYELAMSVDGAPWCTVGLVALQARRSPDVARFDPVVNELGGTSAPPWVVAVREPSYRWSRQLGRRGAVD
jgi:hypothetical protein